VAFLNARLAPVALAAAVAVSCYGPRYDECRVFCQLGACPAGQACGDDGYCYPEGLDQSAHDCALRPDAALADGGGGTDGNGTSDGGGTGPDAAPCPECPFIPSNLGSGQDFFVTTYDLVLGGADEVVLDTDALTLEAMDGPITLPQDVFRVHTGADGELTVFRVRNFTVDYGGLRVRGQRPLVLVATETIQVLGPITHAGVDAECQGSDGGPSALHGGGGAGGSYGSSGGAGTGGSTSTPPGGDPTLVPLRPGCAGGNGGGGGEGQGGAAGRAGGAIQLVAGEALVLDAGICVSGSGGGGGGAGATDANGHGGGGGGGSGGAILLESVALQVEANGALVAHGGGGGGGGGLAFGGSSQPGNRTCTPGASPIGGLGAHDCAGVYNRGGNGAYAGVAAEAGMIAGACSSAGGGGGGGFGRIRINHASGESVSVAASPVPSVGTVALE
jgi:hypothetical protein